MACNQQLWSVERIVCGNGVPDNSGITLSEKTFHGCGSRFGGNESFHPIKFSSLKLHQTMIKLPCFDDNFQGFLNPKEGKLKKKLHDWCIRNPGSVIDISGPGARGEIIGARQHQAREHGPILMVANHGNCGVAALVNGIEAKLGKAPALVAMEKWNNECPRICGLKSIALLLHGLGMNLNVEKIDKSELASYRENSFQWLATRTSGIWVVRVVQNNLVDHVVTVDGERQLILDSAARYPFRLSESLLREVGGSDAKQLRVAEVRKMVLQQTNPHKRKRAIS